MFTTKLTVSFSSLAPLIYYQKSRQLFQNSYLKYFRLCSSI